MKTLATLSRTLSAFLLVLSTAFFPFTPVFAQLGDIAPPSVEAPPAPAPEPTPPPEVTAPVIPEPAPTPTAPEAPTPTTNTEIATQIVTVPSDNTGPVISGLANLA